MSGPDTGDPAAVAVALAELRGTMETGFATLDGKLALLAERGEQTGRRLDDLDRRVTALESARWPWRTIGAMSGVVATAATVVGVVITH